MVALADRPAKVILVGYFLELFERERTNAVEGLEDGSLDFDALRQVLQDLVDPCIRNTVD